MALSSCDTGVLLGRDRCCTRCDHYAVMVAPAHGNGQEEGQR